MLTRFQRNTLFFILVILLATLFSSYWSASSRNTKDPTFNVAYILFSCVADSLRRESGIIDAYQQSPYRSQFNLHPHYASSLDRVALKSIIERMLQTKPDLIMTIGEIPSVIGATLARKRECKVPIVFSNVFDPVGHQLIQSLQSSGNLLTGIATHDSRPTVPAQLFHQIKPALKKLILPCVFTDKGVEEWAYTTKKYLAQYGIETTIAPFDNAHDALIKLPGLISGHDSMMFFEGGLISTVYKGLIRLCNKAGVTLFAGTYDAAREHAAITYAIDPKKSGRYIWHYVEEILLNKKHPASLPVILNPNERSILISRQGAEQQNLDLSKIPPQQELCYTIVE